MKSVGVLLSLVSSWRPPPSPPASLPNLHSLTPTYSHQLTHTNLHASEYIHANLVTATYTHAHTPTSPTPHTNSHTSRHSHQFTHAKTLTHQSVRTEGAEALSCKKSVHRHGVHRRLGRKCMFCIRSCVGETSGSGFHISSMPDNLCHFRIICTTTAMKGNPTTPLNRLCLNVAFMIASYASTGCNVQTAN